jgi:4'-phosphopantetheinyl transferase
MDRSAPPVWQKPDAFPHLTSDEIHIWHADIGAQDCHADWLSAAERERQLARRDLERQRHFCAVRCVLRDLLSQYLACAPAAVDIRVDPAGKPHLPSGRLRFNLSHSHGQALFAFGLDTEVGVDLELDRPVNRVPQIAQRVFTSDEYAGLRRRKFALPRFLELWTCHEARQKCLGQGIFGERPPQDAIHTRSLRLPDAYVCLAWDAADPAPHVRCLAYPPGRAS